MVVIQLGRGHRAIVDDEDEGSLSSFSWFALPGKWGTYAARRRQKADGPGPETILMHREIIGAQRGQQVDHINGDRWTIAVRTYASARLPRIRETGPRQTAITLHGSRG